MFGGRSRRCSEGCPRKERAVMPVGVYPRKPSEDLTGMRFGKWLVKHRSIIKRRGALWVCQCDCGSLQVLNATNLKEGNSKSCGCGGGRFGDLSGEGQKTKE